ncbi:MAG: metal ABC transporter ATP-binding protein [Christensenellales bacterium]
MDNHIIFRDVRFCYGEVCALGGVNFSLREKTLTALIGPNGGGKSTLIKLMAGLLQPETGTVSKGLAVGYVPQITPFDTSFPLTVRELVLMGTLSEKIHPFFKYGYAQKTSASAAIKRVGLSGYESRGISQLSGGQLKRAIIARALASNADVIVLDEPDANLDIDAARDLYAMLHTLKADKTIVIASHHVDAVLDIADCALYVNKNVTVYNAPDVLKDKLKDGLML